MSESVTSDVLQSRIVLPDPPPGPDGTPRSGSLWCKAAPRVLQLALKQQFLEAERREGSLFERIRSHLLLLLKVPSSQLFGFRSQIAPLKRGINPFIFRIFLQRVTVFCYQNRQFRTQLLFFFWTRAKRISLKKHAVRWPSSLPSQRENNG